MTNSNEAPVPPTLSVSAQTDKRVTKPHAKSAMRDGDYLRDLWRLGYFASGGAAKPLVGGGSSNTKDKAKHDRASQLPVSLTQSSEWMRTRKPAPWRDLTEPMKGIFYHLALRSRPDSRMFTLRLSPSVEAEARAQGPRCCEWLYRRFMRHLKRCGVPDTWFWFVLEEDRAGRLHLHGETEVTPQTKEAIRRAFKGAGGTWAHANGKERQFRFHKPWNGFERPTARGAGYAFKHIQKNQSRLAGDDEALRFS